MTQHLTGKQRLFIEEYLVDLNAAGAARRAGYKGNNQTLRVVGHENLTKPNIRSEIERRLNERIMRSEEILFRLTQQAQSDMVDFVSLVGEGASEAARVDLLKAAKAGKLHLVKKIKETRYGLEVELYDKQAALVDLGKYRRLFQEYHLNIDLSTLSEEQLERIANGEDPVHVLATTGQGGAGTA
jgi:phage terminase small subunit